jgi:hypothetical protein
MKNAQQYRGHFCSAVKNKSGKCIRGKNGNMLVNINGRKMVVVARLLRRTDKAVLNGAGDKHS